MKSIIQLTCTCALWSYGTVGRWCMVGAELVLLAPIWERLGVLAVSNVLSAIQYRLCFFPPPTLMMISPSMSSMLKPYYSPCTSLAINVYSLTRVWTVEFVVGPERVL